MQLNVTCDACTRNCTQSATVKANLIDTMDNMEFCSPTYYVLYTIAHHSNKLSDTVKNLKHVVSESRNDNAVLLPTADDEVDDLCWCSK